MKTILKHTKKAVLVMLLLISAGNFQSCMVHKLKVNQPSGEFNGIIKSFDTNNEVNLFITHGMGINELGFADGLVESIQTKLAFKNDTTTYFSNRTSFVKKIVLRKDSLKMNIYVHGWFPAMQEKYILTFIDYDENRLETMDNFKYQLMNQSIADVIMYQGGLRTVIKNDIEGTLKQMVSDAPDANIICISESLGSKMLVETLNENLTEGEPWTTKWKENLRSVYMLSNQLPLLYLGDIKTAQETENKLAVKSLANTTIMTEITKTALLNEIYMPLKKLALQMNQNDKKIQLVAFSDPNDLLTYPIPEQIEYTENFEVFNVSISVAKKGYSWPFGKPKIVNPLNAHLEYKENSKIIDYLVLGHTIK